MSETILVRSLTADFYPGLRRGEEVSQYDGTTIEWTFQAPRRVSVSSGIYEIRFVRTLAEEEALGNPVLGNGTIRYSGDEA